MYQATKIVQNSSAPSAQHCPSLNRPENAPREDNTDDDFRDKSNVDAKSPIKTDISGFYRKIGER